MYNKVAHFGNKFHVFVNFTSLTWQHCIIVKKKHRVSNYYLIRIFFWVSPTHSIIGFLDLSALNELSK